MRRVGKKIIDAENMIVSSPVGSSNYIRIRSSETENNINIFEIKGAILIGKIKGIAEEVELVFDKKRFFDWMKKLKAEK